MSAALQPGEATEQVAGTGPVSLAVDEVPSALDWLQSMIEIREFESVLDPLAMKGLFPGGGHTAIGQEAVAVGISAAIRSDDILACGHRAHHHTLAKGVSIDNAMAELFGRRTGTSGGRGGTMHISDMALGLIGGNGIVGAGLGLAMGAALGLQLQRSDRVAVGIVGDGGANTGRVWEAINLASLWKLPLIAVCENNQYAVQTAISRSMAAPSVARRAEGFGLPAYRVDGQDVVAVRDAVASARRRAAAGDGPTFLEIVTYRYLGHSTGEEQSYRSQEEVDLWREQHDPITRLRQGLEAHRCIEQHEYEDLISTARERVAAAVRSAEVAPWPDPADTFTFVAGGPGLPRWARQDGGRGDGA